MDTKNQQKNLKAFILAAGYGTRLRPLTNKTPKPLLPFMNQSVLFHTLDQIKQTGIKDVCINVHFEKESIIESISKYKAENLNIFVSKEDPILDTGGALTHVNSWRDGSDLLVVNADIIHTFDFNDLIKTHYKEKSLVTLALTKDPLKDETLLWKKEKKLCSFKEPTKDSQSAHGFACMHVLSNKFLSTLPNEKVFGIIPIYQKLLNEGKIIHTHILEGLWYDIGTPEKYLKCHLDFLEIMNQGKKLSHPVFSDIELSKKGFKTTLEWLKKLKIPALDSQIQKAEQKI